MSARSLRYRNSEMRGASAQATPPHSMQHSPYGYGRFITPTYRPKAPHRRLAALRPRSRLPACSILRHIPHVQPALGSASGVGDSPRAAFRAACLGFSSFSLTHLRMAGLAKPTPPEVSS